MKSGLKGIKRLVIISLLALTIVWILAGIALNVAFLDPISRIVEDFKFSDVYYQILQETDEPDVSCDITIVDMSELYNRRDLARAMHEIDSLKPRTIGVDIVFEGLKEDSLGDEMIRDVALKMKRAVFSYRMLDFKNDSTGYALAVHSFFADSLAVDEGYVNVRRELYGGLKRELSTKARCKGSWQLSFVSKLVGVYTGCDNEEKKPSVMSINFSPTEFPMVSADSVSSHPELIRDRLVLFGAISDENDSHYTPLGKMSGVELLAYSVQTLLERNDVCEIPWWAVVLFSFLLVFLTEWWLYCYSVWASNMRNRGVGLFFSNSITKGILLFLWMIIVVWVMFIVFFKYNVSVPLGWSLSAMAFLEMARNFYDECINAFNRK